MQRLACRLLQIVPVVTETLASDQSIPMAETSLHPHFSAQKRNLSREPHGQSMFRSASGKSPEALSVLLVIFERSEKQPSGMFFTKSSWFIIEHSGPAVPLTRVLWAAGLCR
jgi:hypothetical protein